MTMNIFAAVLAATSLFVRISNITGTVSDPNHKNWLEASAVSLGTPREATIKFAPGTSPLQLQNWMMSGDKRTVLIDDVVNGAVQQALKFEGATVKGFNATGPTITIQYVSSNAAAVKVPNDTLTASPPETKESAGSIRPPTQSSNEAEMTINGHAPLRFNLVSVTTDTGVVKFSMRNDFSTFFQAKVAQGQIGDTVVVKIHATTFTLTQVRYLYYYKGQYGNPDVLGLLPLGTSSGPTKYP